MASTCIIIWTPFERPHRHPTPQQQHLWPRPPTFGGSICYIRKYLSASFYVQFQLLELPIWDHKTDILPRQDRLLCVCICVCVCTIDFHFVYCHRRKLMIWHRERKRERYPFPTPHPKAQLSRAYKSAGKSASMFQLLPNFRALFKFIFFYCPLFEIPSHRSSWGTMSYIGNASDLECEKNEFPRPRPTGIVTKMAAHKLSSEPKWADKREDDSDSEVSSPDNFLTKGARSFRNYFFYLFCF